MVLNMMFNSLELILDVKFTLVKYTQIFEFSYYIQFNRNDVVILSKSEIHFELGVEQDFFRTVVSV